MMRCPCYGCELRGPGCHNPERCARWAEYLAATETAKAAQSKRSTVIMQDYVKDKSKNLRKRKR